MHRKRLSRKFGSSTGLQVEYLDGLVKLQLQREPGTRQDGGDCGGPGWQAMRGSGMGVPGLRSDQDMPG